MGMYRMKLWSGLISMDTSDNLVCIMPKSKLSIPASITLIFLENVDGSLFTNTFLHHESIYIKKKLFQFELNVMVFCLP